MPHAFATRSMTSPSVCVSPGAIAPGAGNSLTNAGSGAVCPAFHASSISASAVFQSGRADGLRDGRSCATKAAMAWRQAALISGVNAMGVADGGADTAGLDGDAEGDATGDNGEPLREEWLSSEDVHPALKAPTTSARESRMTG